MKNLLLQTAVAIVGLALGVTTGLYYLRHTSDAATIGQNVHSFSELSERFTKLAKEKGAVHAFDVLRVAKLPPNTDTHLLGHAVGDILYQQKGVQGMANCTQDFRNACSHSIVIGAMSEYGDTGALPLIEEACRNAPGGAGAYTMCYHGLGHGVFAYYGYDLQKTVAFCKKTGSEAHDMREYIECVGGAIMELVGGGGHSHALWLAAREKYLTRDPLSPCTSAVLPDDKTRSICLMYLTPRLVERAGDAQGTMEPKYFAAAVALCNALPTASQDLRASCYGGFGKEFIGLANDRDIRSIDRMNDAQYTVAIAWCNYAQTTDGIDSCIRSEIASVVWGGETKSDAWFRFCALTNGASQEACYSELADSMYQYVRDERGAVLCGRLPDAYQARCTDGPHATTSPSSRASSS